MLRVGAPIARLDESRLRRSPEMPTGREIDDLVKELAVTVVPFGAAERTCGGAFDRFDAAASASLIPATSGLCTAARPAIRSSRRRTSTYTERKLQRRTERQTRCCRSKARRVPCYRFRHPATRTEISWRSHDTDCNDPDGRAGTLLHGRRVLRDLAVAQQTPVRDNPQQRDATATPTGTASIAGIVVNDETPGRPVRRAAVTLTGGDLTSGRTEQTDDDGKFAFGELPPGRYTLAASRPGFVRMAYGARRHYCPGVAVAVRQDRRSPA